MRSFVAKPFIAALAATLLLSGCSTSGGDKKEASPTPSAISVSPSPVASPGEGASGGIGVENTELAMEQSPTPPSWASAGLNSIPTGEWLFSSNENQVIATKAGFELESLIAYVESLKINGWTETAKSEGVPGEYIASLSGPDGTYITIVGMEKAIPDSAGNPASPASSVIYSRS